MHRSISKFNDIQMAKKSSTHHPINTSANFSSTVKIDTMILQIEDAQRHESEALMLKTEQWNMII